MVDLRKELTHGEGLEIIPVVGPDGTVAVLRSDVHVPIRPAVVGAGGENEGFGAAE